MSSFDHILKMLQTQQRINQSLKSYDKISAMIGAESFAFNNLTKVSGIHQVARTITSRMFNPFVGAGHFNNLIDTSYAIAGITTTSNSMRRLAKSQGIMSMLFNTPISLPNPFPAYLDYSTIYGTFNSITTRTGKLAELSGNKEELDAVIELAEQTSSFASAVEEKQYVTIEEFRVFQDKVFQFLIDKVIPKKWLKVSEANWTQFILFIFGVLITYITWRYPYQVGGNEPAKREFAQIQKDTLMKVERFITQDKISKKLNRNFYLRVDDLYSSKKLCIIKKETLVLVLNSTNTWAFVTLVDKEGYPVNGWLPKSVLTTK